ncbi:dethiobiotin synthase [Caminibacter mediatlanticus TB-2]|uniref:Dethiobiotin synthase n=1 Tax=Caminibacter mediatlanticus TB-2 TaxID=391592 RepID=A0AAI9AFZ8_9BACT|nr:dethiobiotin synthase [Caminibacter mediatlanticus]EDM23471.1 Dethiobiotin synthase [Caminibacter mediatlanticus TB-2]QCT94043.1 dethiobiotin synthase [Caminibacter mediatlanticus TB-2]
MNIFISANNTDKGKTYTTLKLIETFSKLGYKVGAMKPIETGVKEKPIDGEKLLNQVKKFNKNFENITINDIVPIQHSLPAAPYVSGEVDFEKIKNAYKKIKPLCDILLIEGAGGILVPINKNFKMIDFIYFFNAKLFLVIGSNLGMINDFLLNKFYLETNKISFTWAINLFDNSYFEISHPFMKQFNPLFIQKDLDKITQKLLKK